MFSIIENIDKIIHLWFRPVELNQNKTMHEIRNRMNFMHVSSIRKMYIPGRNTYLLKYGMVVPAILTLSQPRKNKSP